LISEVSHDPALVNLSLFHVFQEHLSSLTHVLDLGNSPTNHNNIGSGSTGIAYFAEPCSSFLYRLQQQPATLDKSSSYQESIPMRMHCPLHQWPCAVYLNRNYPAALLRLGQTAVSTFNLKYILT
jgi:hypothetical protein